LRAGDIGAVVKLRDTHTGDTLCSPRFSVVLPKVEYPAPNIHGALKLRSKGDEDKLAIGLATLHSEDPTFHYRVDDEIHKTCVSRQGEIHPTGIVGGPDVPFPRRRRDPPDDRPRPGRDPPDGDRRAARAPVRRARGTGGAERP